MKKRAKAKPECEQCAERRDRNTAIMLFVSAIIVLLCVFFIGYYAGRARQRKAAGAQGLQFRMEFERKNDFVYRPAQPQFNCPVKEKF